MEKLKLNDQLIAKRQELCELQTEISTIEKELYNKNRKLDMIKIEWETLLKEFDKKYG